VAKVFFCFPCLNFEFAASRSARSALNSPRQPRGCTGVYQPAVGGDAWRTLRNNHFGPAKRGGGVTITEEE